MDGKQALELYDSLHVEHIRNNCSDAFVDLGLDCIQTWARFHARHLIFKQHSRDKDARLSPAHILLNSVKLDPSDQVASKALTELERVAAHPYRIWNRLLNHALKEGTDQHAAHFFAQIPFAWDVIQNRAPSGQMRLVLVRSPEEREALKKGADAWEAWIKETGDVTRAPLKTYLYDEEHRPDTGWIHPMTPLTVPARFGPYPFSKDGKIQFPITNVMQMEFARLLTVVLHRDLTHQRTITAWLNNMRLQLLTTPSSASDAKTDDNSSLQAQEQEQALALHTARIIQVINWTEVGLQVPEHLASGWIKLQEWLQEHGPELLPRGPWSTEDTIAGFVSQPQYFPPQTLLRQFYSYIQALVQLLKHTQADVVEKKFRKLSCKGIPKAERAKYEEDTMRNIMMERQKGRAQGAEKQADAVPEETPTDNNNEEDQAPPPPQQQQQTTMAV